MKNNKTTDGGAHCKNEQRVVPVTTGVTFGSKMQEIPNEVADLLLPPLLN